MSEQNQTTKPPAKSCRRGKYWLALAAVALVFTGVAGAKAFGSRSMGCFGGHMMHGPGRMMMGPMDSADAEAMAAWMVRRLAWHLNATSEQKTKMTGITKAAVKDLFPLREKMMASRRQAIELLRQPTIDRNAIEKLRVEKIAHIETISKRLAQAFGDMAEVLTPEQRKNLANEISYISKHWHGR
ncbi:MAG: Spy/CpxP family protein refolding chaperone [Alphaproteobacteria bacterium]